jgi:hypothetical protein
MADKEAGLVTSFHKTVGDYFRFIAQGPAEILDDFQNSFEWNCWRGEFVLERSSSETQSISVAMKRWSVDHWTFAVKTYFKNNDSVLTQKIFRRHFNIHRNKRP